MSKIFIIHENDDWTAAITERLGELNLPYECWHLAKGAFDFSKKPSEGIFYNRMSASSHTRGHRYAPELAAAVIAWLEAHGRMVINGSRAIALELSKIAQYASLSKFGIDIPHTAFAAGKDEIIAAAKSLPMPLITKHNRAGKGLGVRLFYQHDELAGYINSDDFEDSIDGITLIQQYIQAEKPFIYRAEFIDGVHLYTVRVSTSDGFELCPADGCSIEDAFCPAESISKFEIVENPHKEFLAKCEEFVRANALGVCAIEFIEDKNGKLYAYDVNTNTNYNREAEEKAGIYAMLEIAKFLGGKLWD